jgi:hypothetical protein
MRMRKIFEMSDHLQLAILKAFVSQVHKQQTTGFHVRFQVLTAASMKFIESFGM